MSGCPQSFVLFMTSHSKHIRNYEWDKVCVLMDDENQFLHAIEN